MATDYFSLIPPEIILLILQRLPNRIVHLCAQTKQSVASIINVNRELLYRKRYDKFSPSIKNLGDCCEMSESTLDFLSMHLDRILCSKEYNIQPEANLMLAMFISKRFDFLPILIKTIMTKHNDDPATYTEIYNFANDLLAQPDTLYGCPIFPEPGSNDDDIIDVKTISSNMV